MRRNMAAAGVIAESTQAREGQQPPAEEAGSTELPPVPGSPANGRSTGGSSVLDMEGVFFRLHSRAVHFVNRWSSPSTRLLLEALILLNGFALLCMLGWFHLKYVSRAESNCVTEVLRRELGSIALESHPQIIKLHVSGIWSQLGREDAKSSEKLTRVIHAPPDGSVVATNLFKVWLQDPVYVYSTERGFLLLDETTRQHFGVSEVSIRLRTEAECFADSAIGEAERYLLDNFIGYDTLILNAFGALFESKGFLYSVHSRELLNVAHVHTNAGGSKSSTVAFKLGAIATTLFLFFITTTLVHHTLRETQERMLKFTLDLQFYVRRGLAYRHLVLNHVVSSLVFVPIMVGMLFFLFEFFNDQLLAFMVLAVVWVCELFSVMSLRTAQNLKAFPRLFFVYFCSFHVYFFLFPSGFSYMALTCCVVFLQHAMLSFFFRYEMPALLAGRITPSKQRELFAEVGTVIGPAAPEVGHAQMGSLALRALSGSRVNSFSSSVPPPPLANQTLLQTQTSLATVSTQANSLASNSPAPIPAAAAAAAAAAVAGQPRQRKKRSTINAEPASEPFPGSGSPPIITAPPPLAVGPRWPDMGDGDDNSSQNSGWEIGGYG